MLGFDVINVIILSEPNRIVNVYVGLRCVIALSAAPSIMCTQKRIGKHMVLRKRKRRSDGLGSAKETKASR